MKKLIALTLVSMISTARADQRLSVIFDARFVKPQSQNMEMIAGPGEPTVLNQRPVHWSQRFVSEPVLGTLTGGVLTALGTMTPPVRFLHDKINGPTHDGSAYLNVVALGGISGALGGLSGSLLHGYLRDEIGTVPSLAVSAAAAGVVGFLVPAKFFGFSSMRGKDYLTYGMFGAIGGLISAGAVELLRRSKNQ